MPNCCRRAYLGASDAHAIAIPVSPNTVRAGRTNRKKAVRGLSESWNKKYAIGYTGRQGREGEG